MLCCTFLLFLFSCCVNDFFVLGRWGFVMSDKGDLLSDGLLICYIKKNSIDYFKCKSRKRIYPLGASLHYPVLTDWDFLTCFKLKTKRRNMNAKREINHKAKESSC
jgi:hypothetical protein